jgi:hypothetical protein
MLTPHKPVFDTQDMLKVCGSKSYYSCEVDDLEHFEKLDAGVLLKALLCRRKPTENLQLLEVVAVMTKMGVVVGLIGH